MSVRVCAFDSMLLELCIALSKILLTAGADQLLYNLSLINLRSARDKQNALVKIANNFIVYYYLI